MSNIFASVAELFGLTREWDGGAKQSENRLLHQLLQEKLNSQDERGICRSDPPFAGWSAEAMKKLREWMRLEEMMADGVRRPVKVSLGKGHRHGRDLVFL